jgi:hypothetical protein
VGESPKLQLYLRGVFSNLQDIATFYSLIPVLTSPSGRELRKPQRDTNSFHPAQDTLT